MEKYILALDQGTTSSRAIIFDKNGNIISVAQKEFTQHFPKPGWVEHDPKEIWSSQTEVVTKSFEDKGLKAENIEAIGITNQRETVIVWDKILVNPFITRLFGKIKEPLIIATILKNKEKNN